MSKLLEVPEVLSIAISALLLFMVQPRSGMASGLDDPSAVGPYLNGVFPSGLSNGGPPGLLSQTGAFTDLKSLEPAPGW